jgi:hypothetical protein
MQQLLIEPLLMSFRLCLKFNGTSRKLRGQRWDRTSAPATPAMAPSNSAAIVAQSFTNTQGPLSFKPLQSQLQSSDTS